MNMENQFIISLIIGILQVYACKGQNNFSPLVGNSKSDIVVVEQAPGNEHELFPDTYSIWFYHEDEPMYIDLSRDDSMTEMLCPALFQLSNYLPDDLMDMDNEDEFAFYHNNHAPDSDKRAHFVLHRSDISRAANVYGEINHDGNILTLQYDGNSNQHKIRRETSLAKHRARRDINPGTQYIVELAVYVAPDLFLFHKNRLGTSSNAQTQAWLEKFSAALIRDVDMTFQKVSTLKLRIQLVGYDNSKSLSASWFDSNFNDPFLADQDTLTDVRSVIQRTLSNYDHAVVLTRADLAKDTTGLKNERQAASKGRICADSSGNSVSIAEVTSAHYRRLVAQAIGLGFGLKQETGSDIYRVMGRDNPSFPIPVANKDDIFLFGNSRETLLADTIGAYTTQCLTDNASGQDFNAFINGDKIGSAYTNDEQCSILFGIGYTLCDGVDVPSKMCYTDVQCQFNSNCVSSIILGQESSCNPAKFLACFYSDCSLSLRSTSSSSSSSSSSSTTSTTPSTTSSSMIPSSSPSPDCCCERRPLGQVKIDIEYIPCPSGEKDD